MKRLILVLFLFIIFLFFILKPKFETETFFSPDKRACITRIDYWSLKKRRTVFIFGTLKHKKIPDKKLEPIYNASLTGGFYLIMQWKMDTAVFYAADGKFNNNLPSKIKFIYLNGHNPNDMKKWFEMKNDTTGKFITFKQKFVPSAPTRFHRVAGYPDIQKK